MAAPTTHPRAELQIDAALVRRLLEEQQPDLAHLPLSLFAQGWDNTLFRLGIDLLVRLPHRAAAAALITHEQRWLPELAVRLPLPIPVPHRVGAPGCGFPWHWSVLPYLPGTPVGPASHLDHTASADSLARFLRALHVPAPADAPDNVWRGVPLARRDPLVREHLAGLDDGRNGAALMALWERARTSEEWDGPPLWVHGDLHPHNLLAETRTGASGASAHLSAVIDFGDLTAGDPATDLSIAWMLFPPASRDAFLESATTALGPQRATTIARARGWALALGLAYVSSARGDAAMQTIGRNTLAAILAEADATM